MKVPSIWGSERRVDGLRDVGRRAWFAAWGLGERIFFRGRMYTLNVPFGNRLYTPWWAPETGSSYSAAYGRAAAGGRIIVSPDRCYVLHGLAAHALQLEGDFAECGVFAGGTAHLLAEALRAAGSDARLELFDTFEGMPSCAEPARDHHGPGDFGDTSLAHVQARLADYPFVRFHAGTIPATFAELDPDQRFALVHADLDIYPSTRDCVEWMWPRIVVGGVMVFDDYGFYHLRRGARAAVDEYFAARITEPIVLPTGQAIVIKARPDQ